MTETQLRAIRDHHGITLSIDRSHCKQAWVIGANGALKTCLVIQGKGDSFGILICPLTLPMLRLLSSKAQGRKDFWKTSKPCLVGIHWKAFVEYSQMYVWKTSKPCLVGIHWKAFVEYSQMYVWKTSKACLVGIHWKALV